MRSNRVDRAARRAIEARVPVVVADADRFPPVDFENDIVPLFSKLRCNGSGCHGKQSGQNGFRLSVFGHDPRGRLSRTSSRRPWAPYLPGRAGAQLTAAEGRWLDAAWRRTTSRAGFDGCRVDSRVDRAGHSVERPRRRTATDKDRHRTNRAVDGRASPVNGSW